MSLGASRTSWEGSGQHRARVRNFRKRLERQLWTGSFLNALAWSAYARCPEITAPPCPTQWGPSGGPQCGHAPVASSCAYFVVLGAQLGLPAGTGRPLCGSPGPGRTRVQAIVPYNLPQDPLAGPSASWGFLGASWEPPGASWGFLEPPGGSWGLLGASWEPPGASWGFLGSSWGLLGASWALPGASWGPPGGSWEPPGRFLGPPGGFLGAPGASWDLLGASWGLPDLLGPPGGFLGPPGSLLGLPGASWGLLGPPGASWSLLGPPGASWGLLGPSKNTCFTIVFALLGPEESWGV